MTTEVLTKKRKNRKKKIILFLSALGLLLVFFIVAAEFTSTSKFCNTCHYMKPFYQSWKESSHRDITCSTCHYPPGIKSFFRAKVEGLLQVGRYWTKLYLKSKPWAEIPDESCLRQGCHDKRLLEGPSKFKKVAFDHKVHLTDLRRGKKLRCTSCHSQIVQGEHITVTESSCFICHFKESEHFPAISDCSHCHLQEDLVSKKTSRYDHSAVYQNSFSCDKCHSHTIVGDGAVPRENCYKCHWERDRLERYEDTDLMHSIHITSHKIECNQCHLEIQHKIVKNIETIADCQTCHLGVHKAEKILFTGEGGKGLDHPMPNIMFEKGLSCKGCHIFHEETGGQLLKSETFFSRAEACESCHGKGFGRILKNWELSNGKKLRQVREVYQRALQEWRQSRNPEKENAKTLLDEAGFNLDIVERGKSVHNVTYAQQLLSISLKSISAALEVIDSAYKPDTRIIDAGQNLGECATCHAGIEEINTAIFGLNFSHKTHVSSQQLECSRCHSNAKTHGELVSSKSSCAPCHHTDSKKECRACHQLQDTFYGGGQLDGFDIPKDIMKEAEVACADCHLDAQKQVFRSDTGKCVECHEESYRETLQEWQDSTRNLVNSLQDSLKEKKKSPLTEEERAKLTRVDRMLQKIILDGSSGVHNAMFFEELLTKLREMLNSPGQGIQDE